MSIDSVIERPTGPLDITNRAFEIAEKPFTEGGGYFGVGKACESGGEFANESALRIILDRSRFIDDDTFVIAAKWLKGWSDNQWVDQERYGAVICNDSLKKRIADVVASGIIYISPEGKMLQSQLRDEKDRIESSGILELYPQNF